jgi:hypothetical protein
MMRETCFADGLKLDAPYRTSPSHTRARGSDALGPDAQCVQPLRRRIRFASRTTQAIVGRPCTCSTRTSEEGRVIRGGGSNVEQKVMHQANDVLNLCSNPPTPFLACHHTHANRAFLKSAKGGPAVLSAAKRFSRCWACALADAVLDGLHGCKPGGGIGVARASHPHFPLLVD